MSVDRKLDSFGEILFFWSTQSTSAAVCFSRRRKQENHSWEIAMTSLMDDDAAAADVLRVSGIDVI